MDKNIEKIRFYLGESQENINLICQFLENAGFVQQPQEMWTVWLSKYTPHNGVFVSIHPIAKSFNLDNSGRDWCNGKFAAGDTTILIDLLLAAPATAATAIPATRPLTGPGSAPGTYPGPYCSCLHPNFVKNSAAGNTFEVCTICKKEKS